MNIHQPDQVGCLRQQYGNWRLIAAILLLVNVVGLLPVAGSPGSTVGRAIARVLPFFSADRTQISLASRSYAYVIAAGQGRFFEDPYAGSKLSQHTLALFRDGTRPTTLYLDVTTKETTKGVWATTRVVREATLSIISVDPDDLPQERLEGARHDAEEQVLSHLEQSDPAWWAVYGDALSRKHIMTELRFLGVVHNLIALLAFVFLIFALWKMLSYRHRT